jgi:chromosome segregation ATPase
MIAESAWYHMKTLSLAVTDAVDALEERLHYSLQKQDLANRIVDMKGRLKSQAAAHEAVKADLESEVTKFKLKYRHEEKERNKATVTLDRYKERLNVAVSEQNQQNRRAEQQGKQITDLQVELEQTRKERSTFHAQLEEYRKKVVGVYSFLSSPVDCEFSDP